jgi:kynureninase
MYSSLAMFREAGLQAVRDKSLDLTGYLMYLADEFLSPLGFSVGTPREADRRGGHVALEHPEAMRIARALRARKVVPDFRVPNVVRLAPVALYTSYAEVWQAVQIIAEVVRSGAYTEHDATQSAVA